MNREGEMAAIIMTLVNRLGGKVTLRANEIERAVCSIDAVHVTKDVDGSMTISVGKQKEVDSHE